MDSRLANAQTLRYAEEFRELHSAERAQRRSLEQALERLDASYRTTVGALAAALELRDDQTGGHAERVTRFALALTREIEPGLAEDPQLEYGFLLHDIGKIGILDAILLKPGPLTQLEREEMEYHPILGERLIAKIPYLNGLARQIVATHHERWDGHGYPRGLSGRTIPLAARIFSIVDAFDAMTNERPYRAALPLATAIGELEKCAGTQFEGELVEAFVSIARVRAAAA